MIYRGYEIRGESAGEEIYEINDDGTVGKVINTNFADEVQYFIEGIGAYFYTIEDTKDAIDKLEPTTDSEAKA